MTVPPEKRPTRGARLKVWVPKQYGAWAMMLAPIVGGSIRAGFTWRHAVLLVTWIAAYLGYMAVRGWFRSRRRACSSLRSSTPSLGSGVRASSYSARPASAYIPPVLTFAVVTLAGVVTLLVWRPALVWWGVPLAVLTGASALLVATGRERTVANDALLMAASGLMAVVAATMGELGTGPGWAGFAAGAFVPSAWLVGLIFTVYFWGTIFYVKTMIRERGKPEWYVASVAYHTLAGVAAIVAGIPLGIVGVVAAARAAVVPRAWPKAKPQWIGVGEIVLTIALLVVVCVPIPGV